MVWNPPQIMRFPSKGMSNSCMAGSSIIFCQATSAVALSGHTIQETLAHLRRLSLPPPLLVAIHPVFAGDAYARLLAAGLARIVSTDTIAHPSNAIALGADLAAAASTLMAASTDSPEDP